MKFEVIATKRGVQGTGASRRLRHAGKVPGIVYGAGKDAAALEMDHNDLLLQLRKEAFHASVLTLNVDGEKEPVLLRDVQVHPFKRQVLHVDFLRVDKTHKIHMKVPFHFLNGENAPGVKLHGGVMSHVLNEAEVICLADKLPEFLDVDLSGLDVGHSLHLSQVKLPEGVEFSAVQRGEDPTIATILGVRGEAEPAAPAAPAGGA